MATLIHASGKIEAITPNNGTVFSGTEIHTLVDGLLECLVLPDGRLMWIDEEGKLKGRLPNLVATFMALEVLQHGDVIVGDAVITTRAEAGEDDKDDDDEDILGDDDEDSEDDDDEDSEGDDEGGHV
jgi:hypothetical protein